MKMAEDITMPKQVDFKGTMVIVSFPAQVSTDFDIYKYIS